MENSLFIAFSKAIFESCGYALLIYSALLICQRFISSASYRYWLAFTALAICFGHFAVSLYTAISEAGSTGGISIFKAGNGNFPIAQATWLQQAEAMMRGYSGTIFGLYLTGFAIQLMRLITGMGKIMWLKNDKTLISDPEWTDLLNLLISKTAAKKISVYFSDKIHVPSTIGFFKPVILFPLAALNQLSLEQAEAILLHELAHIRRHDYLFNLFQSAIEAILFFNPAVWLICKEIRREREYCCDDMVLSHFNEPFSYAKALLLVAENSRNSLPLAMASSDSIKYPLMNRIKRLTIMKTLPESPRQKGIALLMVIAISLSLAFIVPNRALEQLAMQKFAAAKSSIAKMHSKANAVKTPAYIKPAILDKKATTKIRPITTVADTTKKKYKIVVKDDKGNETTYNSINELPAENRKEFLKENAPFYFTGDTLSKAQLAAIQDNAQKWSRQFSSPEWKKQQELIQKYAADMSKQFNSPEWKKQLEGFQKNAELMAKQFNTPEWKKQQEDMAKSAADMARQFNTPEFKKQQAELAKKFNSEAMKKYTEEVRKQVNSPEWKKQQEAMKKYAEQMSKQFNSPEWKKQIQDLNKQFGSPEWNQQQKELLKDLDQLKQNQKELEKLKTDTAGKVKQ